MLSPAVVTLPTQEIPGGHILVPSGYLLPVGLHNDVVQPDIRFAIIYVLHHNHWLLKCLLDLSLDKCCAKVKA